MITDALGAEVISDIAGLKLALAITVQPKDVTVTAGEKASFSVTATGDGLAYQWQYSTDGGETWKDSTAASGKTAKLTTTTKASFDGRLYRCVITDVFGAELVTDAAVLTVK